MKRISVCFFVGVALLAISCNKFLDINTNPNSATSTTPELIIPQALTGTAANLNQYNSYGLQQVGYAANAGGYGGFGTAISYSYTAGDYSGLWPTTYDNLEDYQAILDKTDGQATYMNFNAAARIMRAIGFELLVDAFNSVPYTDALKGSAKLTPTYTDPTVIYKDLVDQLDKSIADINTAIAAPGSALAMGTADVLFNGDMTKWKQLANTIKLRLVIFGTGKVTFSNTTFTSDGFLTTDALINPGFTRDNGRQNPKWNSYGFGYTGSDANKAWIPTKFILSFYNGTKLEDSGRGKAIYYQFPNTGSNQLGYENVDVPKSPSGSFWYPGTGDHRKGAAAGDTTGVLKGPNAGYPLITAAESYFLRAEGVLKGIITGDEAALFSAGITASFKYIYMLPDGSTPGDPNGDAARYQSDNAGSPLVNYSLATSSEKKLEAIITQKYIALNFVNSEAAWNDYRRTHYPTITGTSPTSTFASSVSESTRPDKLPTRVLYPVSEGSYNPANVPKGISPFTSTIFWAL